MKVIVKFVSKSLSVPFLKSSRKFIHLSFILDTQRYKLTFRVSEIEILNIFFKKHFKTDELLRHSPKLVLTAVGCLQTHVLVERLQISPNSFLHFWSPQEISA